MRRKPETLWQRRTAAWNFSRARKCEVPIVTKARAPRKSPQRKSTGDPRHHRRASEISKRRRAGLPVTISFIGHAYDFEQTTKAIRTPKHTPPLKSDTITY